MFYFSMWINHSFILRSALFQLLLHTFILRSALFHLAKRPKLNERKAKQQCGSITLSSCEAHSFILRSDNRLQALNNKQSLRKVAILYNIVCYAFKIYLLCFKYILFCDNIFHNKTKYIITKQNIFITKQNILSQSKIYFITKQNILSQSKI